MSEMEQRMQAMQAAILLYDKLFQNLVQSVSNAGKTCEGAMLFNEGRNLYYLQGKVDAYREVSNRILKEKKMSFDNCMYDRKVNKNLEKIFRGRQIDSIEKVMPEDHYRGNKERYHERERVVQCFWGEMLKSFELGMKFAEMMGKPEFKDMTEEELFQKFLETDGISKETLEWIEQRYAKTY